MHSEPHSYQSYSLSDTDKIGEQIAQQLSFPACVYLDAEMGMGKTTLCKSIIQAFGYSGPVTSPTYNLIQEYPVAAGTIYHMDLYRLNDPAELEFLALADLYTSSSIFLIEWPQQGAGLLPEASHAISISRACAGQTGQRDIVLQKNA